MQPDPEDAASGGPLLKKSATGSSPLKLPVEGPSLLKPPAEGPSVLKPPAEGRSLQKPTAKGPSLLSIFTVVFNEKMFDCLFQNVTRQEPVIHPNQYVLPASKFCGDTVYNTTYQVLIKLYFNEAT